MRAKAAAKAAGAGEAPKADTPPAQPSKPAGKLSPLEMIRAKAAAKKAAEQRKRE
jgi:hypothetical protein